VKGLSGLMADTPERLADVFREWIAVGVDGFNLRLKRSGCDGVQVNFFDYIPDLEFFGSEVLALMRQAGLRAD
jgi:hypothetical protein